MLVGKDRQGDVNAHGGGLLAAVPCHWEDSGLNVLIGVAESLVKLVPKLLGSGFHLLVGGFKGGQVYQVPVQPFAVGLPPGIGAFQLLVGDHPALAHIHCQHPSRLQAALLDNLLRRDVQRSHLGSQDEEAVAGDIAAGGPQAVPVQGGPHQVAVGKEDGGGAVPRLHHSGVIMVKIPLFPADAVLVLPRLRDCRHHGQRQFHAVHHHKLDGVIQNSGVGAAGIHRREDLVHVGLKEGGTHGLFPGKHPVHIAADGVDFPVVEQEPVGMGPLPAGSGVGGKAGVDQGHSGDVPFVLKVVVKAAELVDQEHPLVNDGAAGKGGHIGAAAALLKGAAHHIKPAVKGDAGRDILGLADKALVNLRHTVPGLLPQYLRMNRRLPPKGEIKPFLFDNDLQKLLGLGAQHHILGEEKHSHAVFPFLPQLLAALFGDGAEKRVGNLEHNADAVAYLPGGVLAGAVLQLFHDFQGVVHHPAALDAPDVDHRADAAGVVFKGLAAKPVLYLFQTDSSKSLIFRCLRSLLRPARKGRKPGSPPSPGWASRSRGSSRPGRGKRIQIVPGKEGIPW